ncbi:MAG: cobalt ECF transporter T component CbiQ [Halodesulfurarchaeum sp.]
MTGTVGRSVETITGALRAVFTAEQVARREGFLQQRDPRVTLCSIAALALAVMITRSLALTVFFAALTLLFARLSAVPLRRLAARSGALTLASAIVVLPQVVLHPGTPIAHVFGLAVTDAGLVYVVRFTVRVGTGVALLSVLVMTTTVSSLVGAMRDLGVPVTVVWVIAITYRFLFLFFDELWRLVVARNSRRTGPTGVREGWRDAAHLAGSFLLRTLDRGQRVGRGMRARGGAQPPSPYSRSQRLDRGDYALLGVAVAALVGSGVLQWGL